VAQEQEEHTASSEEEETIWHQHHVDNSVDTKTANESITTNNGSSYAQDWASYV
jgi:hypothetical protein